MHWGNFIPRICSWGRFKDNQTGKTFYLYNMHWDHASQISREKSAQLLITKITQRLHSKDPVIIMGDLNAGENNPAYEYLLRSKDIFLMDSFSNLNLHPQGTFHGFSGKASLPRIDSIMVSKDIKVKTSSILRNHNRSKYPSDHFPVSAILEF
jgi:endonuclease/exonuclease/phosphatase family metal-dependent hydrolase